MSSVNIICENCSNADGTAKYSNWHYCTNPENIREYKIIRTISDYSPKKYKIKPPKWCKRIE